MNKYMFLFTFAKPNNTKTYVCLGFSICFHSQEKCLLGKQFLEKILFIPFCPCQEKFWKKTQNVILEERFSGLAFKDSINLE